MRSTGTGEASFLCDLGPFGRYCKGWSSDSWLPPPRPDVNWVRGVCSCEDQMPLLPVGFLFRRNVSCLLFIVLCFQGKRSLVCVCVCTHHVVCVWKSSGQVKTIEELPPISQIFQRCHLLQRFG